MKSYRIAVLPGDGIGPEIVREAVKSPRRRRRTGRRPFRDGGGFRRRRRLRPLRHPPSRPGHGTRAFERRRSAGRRGRSEMGTPRLQRPAGAGSPRPAVGPRPLREPPSGRRLRGPDRRLAPQARRRPGDRSADRPGASGGRLLRQAPRRPDRERPAGRNQHDGLLGDGDPADREGGVRHGAGAPEKTPLRGQGQRPRNDGALAECRHGGRPGLSGCRTDSTCTWTTARCSSSGIPGSST